MSYTKSISSSFATVGKGVVGDGEGEGAEGLGSLVGRLNGALSIAVGVDGNDVCCPAFWARLINMLLSGL